MSILPSLDRDAMTSGFKMRLQCGNPKEASEWLKHLKQLTVLDESKRDMSERAILEALFYDQEEVVLKIASDRYIEKEMHIAKQLEHAGIPGVLHYYCYMECNDRLQNYLAGKLSSETRLCKPKEATTDTISVLVMEYIKNKNMKSFEWKAAIHEKEIRSCIKQVLATLWVAWKKLRFVHKDMNLQNVLLKKAPRSKNAIEYEGVGAIPIENYEIVLMDFEHSEFSKDEERSRELLCKDMRYFMHKVEYDMSVEVHNISEVLLKIDEAKRRGFDNIRAVLEAVDRCTVSLRESRPNVARYTYNPNAFWAGRPKW